MRVLIVEKSDLIAQDLADIVTSTLTDADVVHARTGDEAIRRLSDDVRPGLVILNARSSTLEPDMVRAAVRQAGLAMILVGQTKPPEVALPANWVQITSPFTESRIAAAVRQVLSDAAG